MNRAPEKKKKKYVAYKKGYNQKYVKKMYSPAFEPPKLTRPEKKFYDVNSSLTPPISSAFVVTPAHLNPMVGGNTVQQRVGIKVVMKSVLIRATIGWNGGQTTSAPSQVRFVVVFDKQANGSVAGRTDVFQDGTYCNSPIQVANAERFVVLADEFSQIGDNGQFCVTWECFRKMNLEVIYGDSTATVPRTGALLLFVAANSLSSDVTTAHFPLVEFYSRIRYTDI